jgi:hypothetical protein
MRITELGRRERRLDLFRLFWTGDGAGRVGRVGSCAGDGRGQRGNGASNGARVCLGRQHTTPPAGGGWVQRRAKKSDWREDQVGCAQWSAVGGAPRSGWPPTRRPGLAQMMVGEMHGGAAAAAAEGCGRGRAAGRQRQRRSDEELPQGVRTWFGYSEDQFAACQAYGLKLRNAGLKRKHWGGINHEIDSGSTSGARRRTLEAIVKGKHARHLDLDHQAGRNGPQ